MSSYIHIAYTEDLKIKEKNPYVSVLEYTSPFSNKEKAISFLKRKMTWLSSNNRFIYTKTFPKHVVSGRHQTRYWSYSKRQQLEYDEYCEFRQKLESCIC